MTLEDKFALYINMTVEEKLSSDIEQWKMNQLA